MQAELVEIGSVARELGVSPATLRNWERRYRLVVAHRGGSGQRLYDRGQIELLRAVIDEIGRGLSAQLAHERALAPHPLRSLRIQLRPSSSAPADARWAVDTLLDGCANGGFAFDLRLLTSELVTNVVLYGSASEPIQLEVRLYHERADIHVRRGGSLGNMERLRARRRDDGRGLELVDALAETWSVERSPSGSELSARLRRRPE